MSSNALLHLLTEPRHRTYVKLAILGLLVLASLLPLRSVRELIAERQEINLAVEQEIALTWGGEQRIIGPVLVVPLTGGAKDRAQPGSETETGITYAPDERSNGHDRLFILPDSLSIDTDLRPQIRHRGIYQVMTYTAETRISGIFAPWHLETFESGNEGLLLWDEARIEVYVSDNRGIANASDLNWNGALLPFEAGYSVNTQLVASLPQFDFAQTARPFTFSFSLDLKGNRTFGFTPLGGNTTATIRSPWPHPSFYGDFLPMESDITSDGFEAHWKLSRFERELNGFWLGSDNTIERIRLRSALSGALLSLVDPVDHYLMSERSVKYGVLFVILVSSVLFVFEIVSGARVHPIQYGMVAAALCLFFLLLLSLSEAIGFGAGYFLAALLTVALLSYYIAGILRSWRRGAVLAGLLAVVYGYMYLTLRSEDHALLLGSLLLFGTLAGAMIVTRGFDWYGVGGRLPVARDSSRNT